MTPRAVLQPARFAGLAVLRCQTDARLVDLVRAGNDRAFEAIVERYRAPLLRYCGRILTPARAEDALQQAFVNAYRAMTRSEGPLELRPWLYRITHNAALNALRAAGPAPEGPLEDRDDAGGEAPEQTFERGERLREVVSSVRGLPENQRAAVVLQAVEGRSYDEIAAELGVTDGAVRQLLHRARLTLRAAATMATPYELLRRLTGEAWAAPAAQRVAELSAAGGLVGGGIVKTGAALLAAGAVAGGATGAVPVPLVRDGEPAAARESIAAAAVPVRSDAPTPALVVRRRVEQVAEAERKERRRARRAAEQRREERERRERAAERERDEDRARERESGDDDSGRGRGRGRGRGGDGLSGGGGSFADPDDDDYPDSDGESGGGDEPDDYDEPDDDSDSGSGSGSSSGSGSRDEAKQLEAEADDDEAATGAGSRSGSGRRR